jgi:hypothetical protein
VGLGADAPVIEVAPVRLKPPDRRFCDLGPELPALVEGQRQVAGRLVGEQPRDTLLAGEPGELPLQ